MRNSSDSPCGFAPVLLRARRDGWTPERQAAFIGHLRASRCVLEACRRVGLSSESAYRLSRRPGAEGFRAAWRAALAGPRPTMARTDPAETNGTCRTRQDHQLPSVAPATPPGAAPAYSLEAFKRALRAGRRRSARPKPSTCGPDGNEWHV